MEAQLRRALLTAPLAAVAAVAVVALTIVLLLAALLGEWWFAGYGIAWSGVLLALLGFPTAYGLTGVLVGVARITRTSLSGVSYRNVAIAAVVGILLACYGLLWLADNLAEWWLPFFATPGGLVGARMFVRLRAQAANAPAS